MRVLCAILLPLAATAAPGVQLVDTVEPTMEPSVIPSYSIKPSVSQRPTSHPTITYQPSITPTSYPTHTYPYEYSQCPHIGCSEFYSGLFPNYGPYHGTIQWGKKLTTTAKITASPLLLADGTIVTALRDGNIFGHTHTGSLKWNYKAGTRASYSTPAIGKDGTIYVAAFYSMIALYPSGSLKWQADVSTPTTTEGIYLVSSPTLSSGGLVYVGAYNISKGGSPSSPVLAFSAATGSLVWVNTDPANRFLSASGVIRTTDDGLYIGNEDSYMYAISASGSTLWRFQSRNLIYATAAIDPYDNVIFGSSDGSMYKLNSTTGDVMFNYTYAINYAVTSSPAIGSDGSIYVVFSLILQSSRSHVLVALTSKGKFKYSVPGNGVSFYSSFPAVGPDDWVYISVGSDISPYSGTIRCIYDGNVVWDHTIANDFFSTSPVIASDGSLIVNTYFGYIYSFVPRALTNKPVRDPTSKPTTASPTISQAPTYVEVCDASSHCPITKTFIKAI